MTGAMFPTAPPEWAEMAELAEMAEMAERLELAQLLAGRPPGLTVDQQARGHKQLPRSSSAERQSRQSTRRWTRLDAMSRNAS